MLNDPAVVETSNNFVRVIVRRPHAYFFLQERFGAKGGLKGTMTGVSFDDGSFAPIPGIYVLDVEGAVKSQVGIASEAAKADLLQALRR